MRIILARHPFFFGVIRTPQLSFTDETVSICFDSAIYIVQILINHLPEVKWFQKLNSTNYIDYAQPLIGYKETKSPINPRRVLESLAHQILDKETEKITFEILYKKWYEKFLK